MHEMYSRIMGYVRMTPWALDRRTMAVMLDLLAFRASGGRLSGDEVARRLGAKRGGRPDVLLVRDDGELVGAVGRGQPMAAVTGGQNAGTLVAVIGVRGIISHRASQVDDMSGPGGTSVERLTARFRGAMNDPAVKAVVFDVDSPGGSVYGVPELADEIRASRGRKPMEAVANALMASAAYCIGSQADRLWVTPSGETGSIGVYAAHVDLSKFYEQMGEKVTLVSYGKNKTLGNPFEPLPDDARADMEKRVNEYGAQFDRDVAKGRGVTTEKVRRDFGQGLIFGAKEATDRGLADGAATLDEVVGRLTRQRPRPAEEPAAAATVASPPAEWGAYLAAQETAARIRLRIASSKWN